MSQEQESQSKLRTIYVDLEGRYIETQAQDGTVLRFSYSPEGIFLSLLQTGTLEGATQRLLVTSQPEAEAARAEAVDQVNEPAPARREKTAPLIIPGKLQTTPVEGRTDGKGNPTAWGKILGHLKDREGAVLIAGTFHGRTREIALRLSEGDSIVAQGYYHPVSNPDERRLPTFSIHHLIGYPGKPSK
jgi:hypothetical protein